MSSWARGLVLLTLALAALLALLAARAGSEGPLLLLLEREGGADAARPAPSGSSPDDDGGSSSATDSGATDSSFTDSSFTDSDSGSAAASASATGSGSATGISIEAGSGAGSSASAGGAGSPAPAAPAGFAAIKAFSVYDCDKYLHAREGPLPDFVVAGVHKGGSTALFSYLADHPAVTPAACKETHFFSDDAKFRKGLHFYRRHFARLEAGQVTGEGTPAYIRDPAATRRIGEAIPRVRVVVSLRDPVERFVSQFVGFLERGVLPRSASCGAFWARELAQLRRCEADYAPAAHQPLPTTLGVNEDEALRRAIAREPLLELRSERFAPCAAPGPSACAARYCLAKHAENAISRGVYADQLVRWLRFFPPEQILLVQSERLQGDTNATMQRVARFLGLAPFPDTALAAFRTARVGSHFHKSPAAASCDRAAMRAVMADANAALARLVAAQWPAETWHAWPA
jgi:hypothetical protein